ncbi:rRNA (cytidine-2'-O-)-methyltransferase [Desulfonema ishimotonii]|uniref:Ribosomal RNA small subunit methyltransferase I n=1 Tax=Desulfonema ishimotonii TaxID=45657 RepID=A0A401FQY8_9BACT|nr:16S rRNA (cytidine(1402)-2'-O)-methyltransferase [Desulfonema ishimotonii]GBC59375.1 rRNA (cytidine-2'-O-)-methyltransferase [Desulfonema ishimotonii]
MDKKGHLYIVATPIGNMEDITLRAIRILAEADVVAAEDTRNTARLLSHHDIRANLISYHEHNEAERTQHLIHKLEQGESVALVSDAGTPCVSDPGYRLARTAIEKGVRVIPIPGVSAAITALSASGLPTDAFTFIGFPPRKKGKRTDLLRTLQSEPRTLIFYESPRRIAAFAEELLDILGDRYAVLSRELTKVYEEFIRGNLSHILEEIRHRPAIKGEITLLVGGFDAAAKEAVTAETLKAEIARSLDQKIKISEISKKISKKYGLPRKEIYGEALNVQQERKSS